MQAETGSTASDPEQAKGLRTGLLGDKRSPQWADLSLKVGFRLLVPAREGPEGWLGDHLIRNTWEPWLQEQGLSLNDGEAGVGGLEGNAIKLP